ncbi:putative protein-cysteine N-palmitoyltransferase porcupine [Trichinella spiralis]|uniref:putative protein-cysteine N-palmitoyltransferase porcupine n=1 Tax=Trichinella spiralis TaxID=6334 RepID=UPI0001EFC73A|nr:putative protein-cysteine N-palmitoyltransferase porcupine [Trichinella spiralis]
MVVWFSQFILLTAEEFNKLSGTLMIIAMKQISLSFAFGVSKWTAACHEPLAFFSYMTDVVFAQQYPMGCGQWRIWVSIFDLFILLKLVAFSQSSENDQQVWQNAVLLSLGFYSYSEYILREKLARLFQACIRARSCYCNCTHKRKWDNFFFYSFICFCFVYFPLRTWIYFKLVMLYVKTFVFTHLV